MTLAEMSLPLRRYVLAVIAGGPLLVVAVALLAGVGGMSAAD